MKRIIEIKIIALSILFFYFLFLPFKVSAITISPVRFELSGNPGEVVTEEFLIMNELDVRETYYISFANFEAQGETGTPAFVEPKDGIGTWFEVPSFSVAVEGGQQKSFPFSVKIPENAEPGGHFGVIFLGNNPSSGQGVSVGNQTGVLVLLSVNGEVKEDAGLLSFKKPKICKEKDDLQKCFTRFFYKTLPVSFEYRFKNDGGDRIKPQGRILIRNTLFLPADKLDANPSEGNVLPGSTRKYTVDWIKYTRPFDYEAPEGFVGKFLDNVSYEWKNFALGLFSANLKIQYGSEPKDASGTVFFFVFPWELVIVILFFASVFFFGGRVLIKRYNKYIIEKAQKEVKKNN